MSEYRVDWIDGIPCVRDSAGKPYCDAYGKQNAERIARALAVLDAQEAAVRQCNGCGHRWTGPAPVTLCGDCWRQTWPFIWGGVNPDARAQAFIEAAREFVALVERAGGTA